MEAAAASQPEGTEPIDPPEDHHCPEDEADEAGMVADASARGWGPGWPTDNRPKMTVVRSGGVALCIRAELAPLVSWLADETVRRGYTLRHGECWGFANRPIRGTRRPSNHSWGLAVDLNAPANPMGTTLVTDMPAWMVELWTSKGFRWGGDYRGRKDAMHYEFLGTPEDAQRLGADVGGSPGQPPPPASGPVLKRGARGPDVHRLQERLRAHGAEIAVDGEFGPATLQAVLAFQRSRELDPDGIVGPRTWAALG